MSKLFTLKQRIMWRIYAVWTARAAISRTALKAYLVAIIFLYTTKFVSYTHVWQNSPALTDVGRDMQFFHSAVTKTESTTLILMLGMAIVAAWIAFDFLPALRRRHV